MWDTICFPLAYILVDEKLVSGFGDMIIAGCYSLISILLLRELWRDRKAGVNWLTILFGTLLLFCSGSYFFWEITNASGSHVEGSQLWGNWVGLLPAIAFFIVYQRYQLLVNSTPSLEFKQELEQMLRETKGKLQQQTQCFPEANLNLAEIQGHLAQVEKLTILGQLVAGIAHEINNPINFIYGNLPYLEEYTQGMFKVIDAYQKIYPANLEIEKILEEVDLDYVRSDFPYIIDSIETGADKIRELVKNISSFYHADESKMRLEDINSGIETSLLLMYKFYKNQVKIIKDFGELPPVECYINQINQVFLTLIAKAINALLESENNCQNLEANRIIISSKRLNHDSIAIQIALNAEIKEQIFEPTFTPKLIGIGTGLGLSISHRIITEVHQGKIYCQSKSGEGTIFTIELPISQVKKPTYRKS